MPVTRNRGRSDNQRKVHEPTTPICPLVMTPPKPQRKVRHRRQNPLSTPSPISSPKPTRAQPKDIDPLQSTYTVSPGHNSTPSPDHTAIVDQTTSTLSPGQNSTSSPDHTANVDPTNETTHTEHNPASSPNTATVDPTNKTTPTLSPGPRPHCNGRSDKRSRPYRVPRLLFRHLPRHVNCRVRRFPRPHLHLFP